MVFIAIFPSQTDSEDVLKAWPEGKRCAPGVIFLKDKIHDARKVAEKIKQPVFVSSFIQGGGYLPPDTVQWLRNKNY